MRTFSRCPIAAPARTATPPVSIPPVPLARPKSHASRPSICFRAIRFRAAPGAPEHVPGRYPPDRAKRDRRPGRSPAPPRADPAVVRPGARSRPGDGARRRPGGGGGAAHGGQRLRDRRAGSVRRPAEPSRGGPRSGARGAAAVRRPARRRCRPARRRLRAARRRGRGAGGPGGAGRRSAGRRGRRARGHAGDTGHDHGHGHGHGHGRADVRDDFGQALRPAQRRRQAGGQGPHQERLGRARQHGRIQQGPGRNQRAGEDRGDLGFRRHRRAAGRLGRRQAQEVPHGQSRHRRRGQAARRLRHRVSGNAGRQRRRLQGVRRPQQARHDRGVHQGVEVRGRRQRPGRPASRPPSGYRARSTSASSSANSTRRSAASTRCGNGTH